MRDPLQVGHSVIDDLDLLGGPEMLPEMLDEVEPRRHYRGRDAPVTAEAKSMTVFAENIRRFGVGEIPLNPVL